MSIILQGSTSGSVTLQEPAVAGTTTINLPASSGTAMVSPQALTIPNTTGTVMVSDNMPAFSAYLNTNQALTANTTTKVQCNTEEWDTANCYDSTTNYRFTPNVAGYYQLSGGVCAQGDCYINVAIYKNGSLWKHLQDTYNTAASGTNVRKAFGSCMVYLNGSTDYVELYATIGASENLQGANNALTYFQGALVRSA